MLKRALDAVRSAGLLLLVRKSKGIRSERQQTPSIMYKTPKQKGAVRIVRPLRDCACSRLQRVRAGQSESASPMHPGNDGRLGASKFTRDVPCRLCQMYAARARAA